MGFQLHATATYTPRGDMGRFIAERITPAVLAATTEAAQVVLVEAQAIVPVDTGALKESGRVVTRETEGAAIADVVFEQPYAAYVEYGTGRAGEASEGAGPYPYDQDWAGMPAQPYLRPALDTARQEMLGIFALRLRQ
jgi:HK97 gp10 family phage protein